MQLARAAWKNQHGDINPFATPEVKEKIKNHWLAPHGVEHIKQIPQILAKCQTTLMKNYGVSNPAQIGIPPDSLLILSSPELLSDHLKQYSLSELGKKLSVRVELIKSYHHRLGLDIIPKNSRSLLEDEVFDFLQSLSVKIIRNDRKIVAPQELDFLLPDHKIAIEFNGLYWHSENAGKKNKHYHASKFNRCFDQNIQLITIWDDEWINNQHIVKNHIRHLIHQTPSVIGARKLAIKEISLIQANEFLENNHIQGSVMTSKYTLGAFHNDVLVSVLTTVKLSDTSSSITRWAVNQEHSYPGLLSRFLKFLHRNHNQTQIETISDSRWSLGKSYQASGFVLDHEITPDYQYTDYVIREHKFNLRKNKIQKRYNIDITAKTEKQLCDQLGFDRIWDCGKKKWVWTA
jgi:hypothetical protein